MIHQPFHYQQHPRSYFDHLVDWPTLEELIVDLEQEHQPEARQLILHALDHAVLETVLHHLPIETHEAFLSICQDQYHQTTTLVWLEEQHEGISIHIEQTIHLTRQALAQLLAEEMVIASGV